MLASETDSTMPAVTASHEPRNDSRSIPRVAFAAQWGQDAMDSGIEWLRAGEEDWAKALVLMRKFADQGVSFTDCISAVLMKRAGLKRIFGFDRHFESMGFRVWPGQAD
jgi:predicted nucleic acid-binding protein